MHTQLRAVADVLTSPTHSLLAGLIAEAHPEPALTADLRDWLIHPNIDRFNQQMRRTQEQGRLPADVNLDAALDLFFGPIYHGHVFHLGTPQLEHLRSLIYLTISTLCGVKPQPGDAVG